MNLRKTALIAMAAALCLAACQLVKTECDQECQDDWLDGRDWNDDCLDTAKVKCLVSQRLPAPTEARKESLQVIIAVHGFTASSFEWGEFARYADSIPDSGRVKVSRVVLGGHGRDLDAFESSTWRKWGEPLLAEYDSLSALGYKHISFACASAGCTILMQYLSDGVFAKRLPPKWIFMIDPFVIPAPKILSLVNLVGPILGNSPDEGTTEENRHWYVNRPEETLAQLYEVSNRVKNGLESGFRLPKGTQALVRKSKHDPNADPVGALLIYKGLRDADGRHLDVRLVDSRLHVFTRLAARSSIPSASDWALQARTFAEITEKALK